MNSLTAHALAGQAAEILSEMEWPDMHESARLFALECMEKIARGKRIEYPIGKKEKLATEDVVAAVKIAMHEPEPATGWPEVWRRTVAKLYSHKNHPDSDTENDIRNIERIWDKYEAQRGVYERPLSLPPRKMKR